MDNRLNLPHKREGIALVIVLALLAVLLIFAVAFATVMRTERLATRYFLEGVKARHLVHTALYRVLGGHLQGEMSGLPYPVWPDPTDAYARYFANTNVALLGDGFVGSPMVFVPASLRSDALFELGVESSPWLGGVEWQELRGPDPDTGDFYGEYAFLVVNTSGLLDANVIGATEANSFPRQRGFDPGEIRFHDQILPEVRNQTLYRYRNAFRRFESMPELHYLTATSGDVDFTTAIGPLPLRPNANRFGPWADHLHVFSRYPRGYGVLGPDGEWDAVDNVACIGGNPAEWDLDELDDAIVDAIDDSDHRAMFIRALYDYADEGLVPFGANEDEQFRRFSAKPVPMVNEVIMSNTVQLIEGPPDILRHTAHITIETWYPFPAPLDPTPFSVEIDGLSFEVVPPYPNMQGPPDQISGPTPANFVPEAETFQLTRFVFQQDQEITDEDGVETFPSGPPLPFQVAFDAEQIRVVQGGDPVDVVFGPWPVDRMRILGLQPPMVLDEDPMGIGPGGEIRPVSASANDPRINWDPSNDLHWDNVAPTPGERNAPRIDAERAQYGYSSDEINWMYARRGPLESVGEIGYLLYDPTEPWTTVPLLDADSDITLLLDRLTVHTNRVRRGLVNINSRQTNALMAAVWQAPVERYPTQPIVENQWVTDSMSRQLASALIEETTGPEGPMANISEIGRAWTPALMNTVLGPDAENDKFIRESVLRNSLGVLGTRNNLFTIFVAARVFVDGYDPATDFADRDDFVASDQRAVVVVWRDPFRTADSIGNQTYETYIQYFHWFTDAFEE